MLMIRLRSSVWSADTKSSRLNYTFAALATRLVHDNSRSNDSRDGRTWQVAAQKQGIKISHNLFFTRETTAFPIESGGALFDQVKIYADGRGHPIFRDPLFRDPANQDFSLSLNSPAYRAHILAGTIPRKGFSRTWWKKDFPPKMVR
jgi:hypothetical protein